MSEYDCELSIIVAAYNSESYISACLESIVSQEGGHTFEVIIVDDGSSDLTGEICQRFSVDGNNVKVIRHPANLGIVATRREGFRYARGRYIAFVDGDDFVEKEHFSHLLFAAMHVDADAVCAGYTELNDNGRKVGFNNKINPGVYVDEGWRAICCQMIYSKSSGYFNIFSYLWNKLFKRDLLASIIHGIDSNILIGEDGALCYPALFSAHRVLVIEEQGYHYRQHSASTVKSGHERSLELERMASLWGYLRSYISSVDEPFVRTQLVAYVSSLIYGRIDSINESIAGHCLYPGLDAALATHYGPIWLIGCGNLGRRVHAWLSRARNISVWTDMGGAPNFMSDVRGRDVSHLDAIVIIAHFDYIDTLKAASWVRGLGVSDQNIFLPNIDDQFNEIELSNIFLEKI